MKAPAKAIAVDPARMPHLDELTSAADFEHAAQSLLPQFPGLQPEQSPFGFGQGVGQGFGQALRPEFSRKK